ncbi:hypothetical protein FRZ06_11470 [Anoxybacterium hadale]|uniref:Uncharacterized protein n=1 Tax=Anoxybacterium hadale TaxID=3408580 RepID=A0ACD1AC45_9FIRM|nr:hypothetical protein FRZ06_11470 [Clostridiales bacterium]
MGTINDITKYSYTRISSSIRIGAAKSDYEDNIWYLRITNLPKYQENCYIGEILVESVTTELIKNTIINPIEDDRCESVWDVIIIVHKVITEEECDNILNDLCNFFTIKSAAANLIQSSGSPVFSHKKMSVTMQYAEESKVFKDTVMLARCFMDKTIGVMSPAKAQFYLPKEPCCLNSSEYLKLYLDALVARDKISRFVLMYGIIEKIFASKEGQHIINTYRKIWIQNNPGQAFRLEKHRGQILLHYFNSKGIDTYSFTGDRELITENLLSEIIQTRNDLFHRIDRSRVNSILYHKLIPIIKEFVSKL